MITKISKRKNWCAENVQHLLYEVVLRTAQNMGHTLSNLSASFVVLSHNGSVGEIHISASHATRSSAVETTFQGKPKISCQSVQGQESVRLK